MGAMKAGVLSFLVLLGSINEICEGAQTAVERCGDSMVCFAPTSCSIAGSSGSSDHSLMLIKSNAINDNCAVILKFRKYSIKKFRVVLESRDTKVEKISFKKHGGSDYFLCEKGQAPKFKNGAPKSIFATSSDRVMCDFEAEEPGAKMFDADMSKKITVTSDEGKPSAIAATSNENFLQGSFDNEFCDPGKAKYVEDTTPGIASKIFDLGLTDITCAAPYSMQTKTSSDPVFVTSASVECKEDGGKYKFTISRDAPQNSQIIEPTKSFNARCVVPVCALCDETTAELSADPKAAPKIENVDGCKELTCASGRMKVGDEVSLDSAKCESESDQPIWMLDGKPVKATVTCVDPVPCKSTQEMCSDGTCVVGADLLPTCGPQSILMYNKKPINITCNDFNGKYEYPGPNGPRILPDDAKFTCEKQDTDAKTEPAPASLWSKISIPVIVIGVLILIGLAVGVYFRVRYVRKKQLQSVKSSAKGTVKSKESLSGSALPSSSKVATPGAATPTASGAPGAAPAAAAAAAAPAPEAVAPAPVADNVYDRLGLGPALRPLPPQLLHPEESERMKKILRMAEAAEHAKHAHDKNDDKVDQQRKSEEQKQKEEKKEKKDKKDKKPSKTELKKAIAAIEEKEKELEKELEREADKEKKVIEANKDFVKDCSGKGLATAGGVTEAGPDPFGPDKKKKEKQGEKKQTVKAIPSDVESDSQTGPGPKKKH